MKKILFILSISVLFFSCNKIEFFQSPVEELFQKAKREKKNVCLIVGNKECPRCELLISDMNKNRNAKIVLKEGYFCGKVNMDGYWGKDISLITGCRFFPYTCFFDADGTLKSLRIGSEKFDFNHIQKHRMDPFHFQELFQLPISPDQYKQMISYNMKCHLKLLGTKEDKNLKEAFELIEASINILPTCYNLYKAAVISMALNDTLQFTEYKKRYKENYTYEDSFLYAGLTAKLGIVYDGILKSKKVVPTKINFSPLILQCDTIKTKTDYKFNYKVRNNSDKPLVIRLARHSCDCMDIEWTKEPIMPRKIGNVSGVFHAKKKGRFRKQIFVHVDSNVKPMYILVIEGVVV